MGERRAGPVARSRDDLVVGGVCGGLGRGLGVDPWIVRVLVLAALVVSTGAVVGVYVVLCVVVPPDRRGGPAKVGTGVGLLALLAAVGLLVVGLGPGIDTGWVVVLGAGVLVLGIVVRYALRGPVRDPRALLRRAGVALGSVIAAGAVLAGAAVLTATGLGALLAVAVVGLGLLIALGPPRSRRATGLLVALAFGLIAPASVVAASGASGHGGLGRRVVAPAGTAALPAKVQLGAGSVIVDLRRWRWPLGGVAHLSVSVGLGRALIVVPKDVCVVGDGSVGAGRVSYLGPHGSGLDRHVDAFHRVQRLSPGRRRLVLKGSVGVGTLVVRQRRSGFPHRDFSVGSGGSDAYGPYSFSAGSDAEIGELESARLACVGG